MFGDDEGGGVKGDSEDRGDVVSVVGAGMEVEGDCQCEGSLRVDGRVQGTIRAGKSVVVGEGGEIEGEIHTQDAVVAGHVAGTIHAESRVELKDGSSVEGDIRSPSIRLEEGGRVDGELDMSEESPGGGAPVRRAEGSSGDGEASAAAGASGEGTRETAGSKGEE